MKDYLAATAIFLLNVNMMLALHSSELPVRNTSLVRSFGSFYSYLIWESILYNMTQIYFLL